MNERIREFLLKENKSSAQLAEEIGVQPSGISHILSGRNHPSLDFILKMLNKYQYLSTDWLLFGKGSMYKDSQSESLFNENDEKEYNSTSNASQNVLQDVSGNAKPLLNQEARGNIAETAKKGHSSVVKIVWFYSDNSFEEFYPGR